VVVAGERVSARLAVEVAGCRSSPPDGWKKTRDKAKDKDASLGADCGGAMSDAVRDSVERVAE
jgi:hypothetical protein